jgi:hypothetical protein
VAALTVVHGAASWVRGRRARDIERAPAIATAEPAPSVASQTAGQGVEATPTSPVPVRPEAVETEPDTDLTIPPIDAEAVALDEPTPDGPGSPPEIDLPAASEPAGLPEPPETAQPPEPSADPT